LKDYAKQNYIEKKFHFLHYKLLTKFFKIFKMGGTRFETAEYRRMVKNCTVHILPILNCTQVNRRVIPYSKQWLQN